MSRTERIFGMLCTRNEAGRYLADVLEHHGRFLDDLFVWDDRSTDDTVATARHHATVEVRPEGTPSFKDNESGFRQAGWKAMEAALVPTPEVDWVLAFDADEFFWAGGRDRGHERRILEVLVDAAHAAARGRVRLRVDEVFDAAGPKRRIDGLWGTISAERLVRYRPNARFGDRRLGGGSVPGSEESLNAVDWFCAIRHYGYARPEDRQAKYHRYAGRPGHHPNHVESILSTPILETIP